MPATNRRNFVAGATAAAATAPFLGREAEAAPSDIGQWSSVLWWPCVAIHMIQLGDNILTIQDDDAVFPARGANFSKAFVVHIGEGDEPRPPAIYIPNKTTNLFCAGHSIMPGNTPQVMILGGHEGQQYLGSTDVTIFEYGGASYTGRPCATRR